MTFTLSGILSGEVPGVAGEAPEVEAGLFLRPIATSTGSIAGPVGGFAVAPDTIINTLHNSDGDSF